MTATIVEQLVHREAAGPRIALVMGNDILRDGLAVALRGLVLAGPVRAYRSMTELAETTGERPDVLVVNAADGVPGIAAGSLLVPGAKIVMLIHDARAAEAVLASGVVVDGFLLQQDLSGRTLENALRAIMTGEVPMPAVLAQQLLAHAGIRRAPASPAPISLTPREHETLVLLVEGLSNKQIARRLKISDHGAKRLVAGVLLKLGSTNRTSAVVTAIRSGLVECA
ncbi:response regulator transcription factor [Paractinoplanes hotanensis]|uniref:Response regulator transcription factor n=1 Tax=Paractinoplanes hotanensis TaxID=2906497 RepID=A0ABT0Y5Y9_9ACTN|nr:response regulator transcription factor [Actinoplanes hotanensis]MCM4081442.1 response regulator transcription factor [Actinoplanes hotanensis]